MSLSVKKYALINILAFLKNLVLWSLHPLLVDTYPSNIHYYLSESYGAYTIKFTSTLTFYHSAVWKSVWFSTHRNLYCGSVSCMTSHLDKYLTCDLDSATCLEENVPLTSSYTFHSLFLSLLLFFQHSLAFLLEWRYASRVFVVFWTVLSVLMCYQCNPCPIIRR